MATIRMPVPSRMKALRLTSLDGPDGLHLETVPVPLVRPGYVLVRVLASPVNQSDLLFIQGRYGLRPRLPVTPGFEGSGIVVQNGGGLLGRALLGRRVACGSQSGDGLWAEYVAVPASSCLPLPRAVSDEQGACAIVNPLTAWALMNPLRRRQHAALVQTAAASQLGKMVIRMAARLRTPLVNIVHRAGLVDELRQLGVEHVLDSSEPAFGSRFSELIGRLKPTYAIDAVGGPLGQQLIEQLPTGSTIVQYGLLSGQSVTISPRRMIFENKRIEGFHLRFWLEQQSLVRRLSTFLAVRGLLARELGTAVAARTTLEDAPRILAQGLESRSSGKILILPAAPDSP